MIDHHQHVCHRMQAARATGDRYAVERSWCVAPESTKMPGFVWQFIGWAVALTCLFVFTPVIVRSLMQ